MAKLERNWRWLSGIGLVVIVAVCAWQWRSAHARTAMMMLDDVGGGNQGYTPLTQLTHDAIASLMADVSLDREALIALNPSANQAESILSAVRTWQGSNASTVASNNQTIAQKMTAVRIAEKAIAMGPYNENNASNLATARQDLLTAQAAYRSTLSGLESTVSNLLSQSQQATWAAIKTGWGQRMPIRMLALTDEQRMAVSDAHQRYERQYSAASDDSGRSTAVSTYQTALDSILNADQKTAMQGYGTNYASASSAVNGAFDTVLAVQSQQG